MLNLTYTPDASPPTLVPGSKWRRKSDGAVCVLLSDGSTRGFNPWTLMNDYAVVCIDDEWWRSTGMMAELLARDFDPVDPPQDNRTVGELEQGECFVLNANSDDVWMRSCDRDNMQVRCSNLRHGLIIMVGCEVIPTRILGRINPDSIAAILREAGGDVR